MKVAELKAFGNPPEVVDCIEVDGPGEPAADEILVDTTAGPINPAEILLIQGRYASRPPLPARLGIEGAGRVRAVGSAVSDLQPGDSVMLMGRTNWAEQQCVKRAAVIKLPADVDPYQAAILKVNPATALMLLRDYVDLQAGDWLIQNAANSGVGTCLIALARASGIRTVNVVRRESLIAPLQQQGADIVIVDGDDLAARVRAETGDDAPIKLAIDAVAGRACLRLAECLSDGGTVVNYGLLSGEPCMLGSEQTVFRGISLTGFWLAKTLGSLDSASIQGLYSELAGRVMDGTVHVPVEATYPLTEIKQALAHAMRQGRDGKILVLPNA